MIDPMNMPQMPMQGPQGPSPVTKNLSALNPNDASLMAASGQISPDMSIRDFFQKQGIDVDGPVTQLVDFAKKQVQNANPINKMRNIASEASLKPGGAPPTMPGAKPMVAPPSAPAPSGMEGLLNRLGGK